MTIETGSSLFGPYTLTRVIGKSLINPDTIIYLPAGSDTTECIQKGIDFLKKHSHPSSFRGKSSLINLRYNLP